MKNFECDTCKYIAYESCNMNGYCNNPNCKHYRELIVDDSGCYIEFCENYEENFDNDR